MSKVPQQAGRGHSIGRAVTLAYAALIVYGSLYPFSGWTNSSRGLLDFLGRGLRGQLHGADALINVLAYVPFGAAAGAQAGAPGFTRRVGHDRDAGGRGAEFHDGVPAAVPAEPRRVDRRSDHQHPGNAGRRDRRGLRSPRCVAGGNARALAQPVVQARSPRRPGACCDRPVGAFPDDAARAVARHRRTAARARPALANVAASRPVRRRAVGDLRARHRRARASRKNPRPFRQIGRDAVRSVRRGCPALQGPGRHPPAVDGGLGRRIGGPGHRAAAVRCALASPSPGSAPS